METFKIQFQLDDREKILVGDIACIPAFGFCFLAAPFMFVHTLMRSEANKRDVVVVYDADDHALYYYELNISPAMRYDQATINLANPIREASASEKCDSLSACMKEYVAELHLRGLETGHQVDPASEILFQRQIEIAQEIDDHKITREDAIKELLKVQIPP
jgi:hypothetical protein